MGEQEDKLTIEFGELGQEVREEFQAHLQVWTFQIHPTVLHSICEGKRFLVFLSIYKKRLTKGANEATWNIITIISLGYIGQIKLKNIP